MEEVLNDVENYNEEQRNVSATCMEYMLPLMQSKSIHSRLDLS